MKAEVRFIGNLTGVLLFSFIISSCGKSIITRNDTQTPETQNAVPAAVKEGVPENLKPVKPEAQPTDEKTRKNCDEQRKKVLQRIVTKQGDVDRLLQLMNHMHSAITPEAHKELTYYASLLEEGSRATQQKKINAAKRSLRLYQLAFKKAGMRVTGNEFAEVFTQSDGQAQVYLGVDMKSSILAAVSRKIMKDQSLYVFKLNWKPGSDLYALSVHIFPLKAGFTLNNQAGIPRQDIVASTTFSGSAYKYIEVKLIENECKGITEMDVRTQQSFSTIKVGTQNI